MRTKIISLLFCAFLYITESVSQSLDVQFSHNFGGKGCDYLNEMQKIKSSYILYGSFVGNPTDTILDPLNNNNAWFAICDSNGVILDRKVFGNQGFETITSVAETPSGFLLTGIFQDSLIVDSIQIKTPSFLGGYLAEVENNCIVNLSAFGGNAIIKSCLIEPSNSYYFCTGIFNDSITLSNRAMSNSGDKGIFLFKYFLNGIEEDPHIIKTSGECTINSITSNDSLVIIGGAFSDSLFLIDTTLVSVGGANAFIIAYHHNFKRSWIKVMSGIGDSYINSVQLSQNGDLGCTGYFEYSVIVDDFVLNSTGGRDAFILVTDLNGDIRWSKSIGSFGDDSGHIIQANNMNEFYISGSFSNSLSMNDDNGDEVGLTSFSPFGNAFIAKFKLDGQLNASFNIPASTEDYCRSLIVESDGSIVVAGNFYGAMRIKNTEGTETVIESNGSKDMFLIKFVEQCNNFIADAGPDTSICSGQTIWLESNYPSFIWKPGGRLNKPLAVTQPGKYILEAINELGCISIDTLEVRLKKSPFLNAGPDLTSPPGIEITLNDVISSDAETIRWQTTGSGYFSDPHIVNATYFMSNNDIAIGEFNISIHAMNSCSQVSDTITVFVLTEINGITVYPNPCIDQITLVCTDGLIIEKVTLMTQGGYVLLNHQSVFDTVFETNLSMYPPGTYIFNITTNLGFVTKTINKL